MTSEKAISELTSWIINHYTSGDIEPAIKEGVYALCKQTPVKPDKYKHAWLNPFRDTVGECDYKCPACGESLAACPYDDFYNYGLNYCDSCGQHIDWSDVRGQVTWFREKK